MINILKRIMKFISYTVAIAVVLFFISYIIGVILLIMNESYYIIYRGFFDKVFELLLMVYRGIENWFYEVALVFLGRFSTNVKANLKSIFHGVVLFSTLVLNFRRYKVLKKDEEAS